MRRVRRLIAFFIVGALAVASAARAETPASERAFADWTLRCEAAVCWIYSEVPDPDRPDARYSLAIGTAPAPERHRVLVHTGKAASLTRRKGIDLYVDGRKTGTLAFDNCRGGDCVFLADYPPAVMRRIVAAQSLALFAADAVLVQGVSRNVSTAGLKPAFRALEEGARQEAPR